jgi:hypothetical protein
MALATRWKGDGSPELRPLSRLRVKLPSDNATLAHLNRMDQDEVFARRSAGHRPYMAYVNGTAVNPDRCWPPAAADHISRCSGAIQKRPSE